MKRVTKLSRNQIAEFAKDPQQIKYFEALQENVSELPDAIAVLTAAVAEAQFDADIATTSANEALTLANQKAAEDGDFLPEMVVQPPNASDSISSAVVGAATKATPVDADLLPLVDSAAGYTLKNLTWANLKATLKTYFDSVVTTLTNKTIALGSNTISGTLAQFNTAVTDADLASLAGVETLTNKTINLTSNTLVATSAQLAEALTDETGTGVAVFSASPALTGTPTAPTAAAGTNTTQIATTAFANNLATGPAFSAYQTTRQSLAAGVDTKIQFQTEQYDTAGAFDSVTNYRFTPLVSGYYAVIFRAQVIATTNLIVSLRKNGTIIAYATYDSNTAPDPLKIGTDEVFMNGSTDYLEVFINSSVAGNTQNTLETTAFKAHMARPA